MPRLRLAPTRSNLLSLKRQLAFTEEGQELLEQKRELLVIELLRRLDRTKRLQTELQQALATAFQALREAELDAGTDTVESAALGVPWGHELALSTQRLLGMPLPRVELTLASEKRYPGVEGTPASLDPAVERFTAVLPLLAELAELSATVSRLAEELRKTQLRCNALSKIVIPDLRSTAGTIAAALEEREREFFVVLKRVRDRLSG